MRLPTSRRSSINMTWPRTAPTPNAGAAVERKLEIIGEACTRIRNSDPDALNALSYAQQVIGLRNRVIHGYDNVDDAIIWDVVSNKLASFIARVETLARS
jgi:uncharacterized protein with HEPN domain